MKKLYLFTVTLALLVMSGLLTSTTYAQDKQHNIVVIMGDDIGKWNIGACHHGMMAGRSSNINKLAAKGAILADYCAEVSCTADRASIITGEVPVHSSLTMVGQAGAKIRMPDAAPTIAAILKDLEFDPYRNLPGLIGIIS